MSSNPVTLKPCPFCGHNPTLAVDANSIENGVWLGCMNDDCVVMPWLSEMGSDVTAVAGVWNRRAPEASAKSVDSLRSVREHIYAIIEPWIGANGDIIPREVQQLVVLSNDLHNMAETGAEAAREDHACCVSGCREQGIPRVPGVYCNTHWKQGNAPTTDDR